MARKTKLVAALACLALAGAGEAAAQVTASGRAFSTRAELLGSVPLLVTGDTITNGIDAGEDFASGPPAASFNDTAPGTILDLDPLAVVNGGDSTILGSVVSPTNASASSTAGAATADVIPNLLGPSLLEAATRAAQVDLSCSGFTASSSVDLLVINGTPIEIPGSDPLVILGQQLPLVEVNQTRVSNLDIDPDDGDACSITVTQTALRANVADPLLGILDLKLSEASASLDNIDCGCAVFGQPTPTPPSGSPTPTQTGGADDGGADDGGADDGGADDGGADDGGGIATPTPTLSLETTGGGGCSIGPDGAGNGALPALATLGLLFWMARRGRGRRSGDG